MVILGHYSKLCFLTDVICYGLGLAAAANSNYSWNITDDVVTNTNNSNRIA